MSTAIKLYVLLWIVMGCTDAFAQSLTGGETDELVWCRPKFYFQVPKSVCDQPKSKLLAPSVEESPVGKAYVDCLISNVRSGRYRSFDINQATLQLTLDCGKERDAYAQQCVVAGGPFILPHCDGSVCVRTPIEECRLKAGLVAATAIKFGNNAVGQNWDDLVEQLNRPGTPN